MYITIYQSTYKEKVVRTVFFTLRVTGTGDRSFCSLILKINTNTVQSVTLTVRKGPAEMTCFMYNFFKAIH